LLVEDLYLIIQV